MIQYFLGSVPSSFSDIILLIKLTFLLGLTLFRGYIEAVREIEQHIQSGPSHVKFDDIVVACGRLSCT